MTERIGTIEGGYVFRCLRPDHVGVYDEHVSRGAYNALAARLAEAERNEETLLGMIRHQRDVLRECLPYINESMAGRRPGRCADDIRAAVKALTADSASACQHEWVWMDPHNACKKCGMTDAEGSHVDHVISRNVTTGTAYCHDCDIMFSPAVDVDAGQKP